MNNQTKQVKRVLQKARSLISRSNRWTQGAYKQRNSNGDMAYCAVGAVRAAKQKMGLTYDLELSAKVAKALQATIDKSGYSKLKYSSLGIVEWNDSKGRKHSEVVRLFDQTIESLE
jgi:hypothetical protein